MPKITPELQKELASMGKSLDRKFLQNNGEPVAVIYQVRKKSFDKIKEAGLLESMGDEVWHRYGAVLGLGTVSAATADLYIVRKPEAANLREILRGVFMSPELVPSYCILDEEDLPFIKHVKRAFEGTEIRSLLNAVIYYEVFSNPKYARASKPINPEIQVKCRWANQLMILREDMKCRV